MTPFDWVTHSFFRLTTWRSGENRVPLWYTHDGLSPPSHTGFALAPVSSLVCRLCPCTGPGYPRILWHSLAAAPPIPWISDTPTLQPSVVRLPVVDLLHLHRVDVKTSRPRHPLPSSVSVGIFVFENKYFGGGSTLGRSQSVTPWSRDLATLTPAPGHPSLKLGSVTHGYTCVLRTTDPFMKGSCPV
jgi:hypothetical protein